MYHVQIKKLHIFYYFKFSRIARKTGATTYAVSKWSDFKYKYEDFIFEIALPVTVRFNNWKEEVNSKALNDDPSFMTFDFRVKYSQDWGTPYLEICDNDTFAPVVFNDDMGELIGVVVQPGALFDIEGCKIDVGFKNEITAKDGDGKHRYGWSIPVTLRMNF